MGGGGVERACVCVCVCVCVCEGGQPLRTAHHIISTILQNSFCESHTWRLENWKGSKST